MFRTKMSFTTSTENLEVVMLVMERFTSYGAIHDLEVDSGMVKTTIMVDRRRVGEYERVTRTLWLKNLIV